MTIKAFAKAEGPNPSTLGWWRWRVRQSETAEPKELTFTEVVVGDVVDEDEPTVVLALDSYDAHVVVDAHTDLQLLRDLLMALA